MALKSLALASPVTGFTYCMSGFAYACRWFHNFNRPYFVSWRLSQLAKLDGDTGGKMHYPHYPDLTLCTRSVFTEKRIKLLIIWPYHTLYGPDP